MNDKNDLTKGSVGKNLLLFAMPYLLSCFMQTFYGMADLFVVGLYNGSETTTAVSIGSQVMHMLTVIIVGFAMGTTVRVGRSVGAGDEKAAAETAARQHDGDCQSYVNPGRGGSGDEGLPCDMFCGGSVHHRI